VSRRWYLATTCVASDGQSINDMTAAAKEITYRTFRKHLGRALVEAEHGLGYDTGRRREIGLRMAKDWAVSYFRSTYQGKPCFYFRWSAIEHIFLEAQ
jgi:hypothetical protein